MLQGQISLVCCLLSDMSLSDFLIVYIFNSNYYDMLFYLQTACVIIVMTHMWFQPYCNEFLNASDGVMLLYSGKFSEGKIFGK